MNEPIHPVPGTAVVAERGMVAASQPLAVQAGIEALKAGGHAVDAAIAANAMLGLVEPMSCGLGGDAFAIVWDAEEQRLFGLNGSGRAPRAMTPGAFRERKLERIPTYGPLSWTVPGCVAAWYTLHERFGRLSMRDLLRPAIENAESGFEVTPVIAEMWGEAAERLSADPGARATFLRRGRAPTAAETVRNPELAHSLQRIADEGPAAFYRGAIAEAIVRCACETGGLIDAEDLANHETTWVEPVSTRFRGFDIWELPPSTQGITLLEMLNILEGFDLRSLGPLSAETLHLCIEAKKLAYEDRARHIADPDFASLPVSTLLSDDYARAQRLRIDPARAAAAYPHGEFPASDTVYLTAVDESRNAVSVIQSIYHSFGSGIAPPGLGFALQNRGSLFHLEPDHPNRLEPGKRPFHTVIPAMVTLDGQPVFSFGVMGGDMQPQGQLQVLVNLLEFAMDPQAAGDAPRWRHDGSSTPTGDRMTSGGTVSLESGFPPETAETLRTLGHRVRVQDGGYGGYQGIWIDREGGRLYGGSERRKDGCASGY